LILEIRLKPAGQRRTSYNSKLKKGIKI